MASALRLSELTEIKAPHRNRLLPVSHRSRYTYSSTTPLLVPERVIRNVELRQAVAMVTATTTSVINTMSLAAHADMGDQNVTDHRTMTGRSLGPQSRPTVILEDQLRRNRSPGPHLGTITAIPRAIMTILHQSTPLIVCSLNLYIIAVIMPILRMHKHVVTQGSAQHTEETRTSFRPRTCIQPSSTATSNTGSMTIPRPLCLNL
jgi:hypothetical protein